MEWLIFVIISKIALPWIDFSFTSSQSTASRFAKSWVLLPNFFPMPCTLPGTAARHVRREALPCKSVTESSTSKCQKFWIHSRLSLVVWFSCFAWRRRDTLSPSSLRRRMIFKIHLEILFASFCGCFHAKKVNFLLFCLHLVIKFDDVCKICRGTAIGTAIYKE